MFTLVWEMQDVCCSWKLIKVIAQYFACLKKKIGSAAGKNVVCVLFCFLKVKTQSRLSNISMK